MAVLSLKETGAELSDRELKRASRLSSFNDEKQKSRQNKHKKHGFGTISAILLLICRQIFWVQKHILQFQVLIKTHQCPVTFLQKNSSLHFQGKLHSNGNISPFQRKFLYHRHAAFSQLSYDQNSHPIAYQKLPVPNTRPGHDSRPNCFLFAQVISLNRLKRDILVQVNNV